MYSELKNKTDERNKNKFNYSWSGSKTSLFNH